MTQPMVFETHDWSLIVDALCIAAEMYRKDADEVRCCSSCLTGQAQDRLVQQFEKQADESIRISAQIQEAQGV